MCDFISWIQKGGRILFLTDKDVFSSRGKELLGDCKDNDVLGHEALRFYYGKDGKSLKGGEDYEERFFWEVEKLPKEIQALHPEDPDQFIQHWGRMWNGGFFQKNDLHHIIHYTPDPWKMRAWDRLVKQGLSSDDLRYIIYNASELLKKRAWNRLIRQSPSNDELICIIYNASEPWIEKAWNRLIRQSPSYSDLCYLICYAPDPYKELVRAELKKRFQ